jgi:hypothetical protein
VSSQALYFDYFSNETFSEGKASMVYTKRRRFDMPNVLGHISRPPEARNAGGVIGPLIASTGNLMAFATPTSGQLQPNVKRPGYKLSR